MTVSVMRCCMADQNGSWIFIWLMLISRIFFDMSPPLGCWLGFADRGGSVGG